MQPKIPKEWLDFCEFNHTPFEGRCYFFDEKQRGVIIIPLSEIEPPRRASGLEPFKKNKMVPVLMALIGGEDKLPPIEVALMEPGAMYKYKLEDGFHRFYAAAMAGYKLIPATVVSLKF